MNYKKTLINSILLISLFYFLNSCGIYRPVSAKDYPPEPEKRVAKNIEEGRGFRLSGGGQKGGTFDFASSNELWRASLDTIDFMPLASANYSGGIIITDWYNEDGSGKDSIKIMVRFLSNEIRADGLKVTVYNKSCVLDSGIQNCSTEIDETGQIGQELKLAILKKASIFKNQDQKEDAEKFMKNRKPVNRDRDGQDKN